MRTFQSCFQPENFSNVLLLLFSFILLPVSFKFYVLAMVTKKKKQQKNADFKKVKLKVGKKLKKTTTTDTTITGISYATFSLIGVIVTSIGYHLQVISLLPIELFLMTNEF